MTGTRVAVLGAGSWGTALANVAARAGNVATLIARDPELARAIAQTRENGRYLPGIAVEPSVAATADAPPAIAAADIVLLVTPAQHLRASLEGLAGAVRPATPLVIASKGIERGTDALLSTVVEEAVPHAVPAVLSGPSFAADVARGLPTAVTLACRDRAERERLATRLALPAFRLYPTDDVVGAQVGGAVKNVLAIACGACDGLALGDSARAALTARGFTEMARLGAAMGAELDTLAGLSGLGDLVLTCGSRQSRNFSLGRELGEGRPLEEILAGRRSVSEGVPTAAAVVDLARRHQVAMPISEAVADVVSGRVTVRQAVGALLARPPREEGVHGRAWGPAGG